MGDDEWIKLPTEEKVLHKVWKARVAGYEEAMQMFARARDDKAPEFGRYLGLLKKFVVDNNIVAQEKGLDAVLSFLENAHHTLSAKTVGEVISGIVAKCLNARARTKEKGQEVIMIYIELEKHELVMEELIKGLANKQPKIVTACLETIKMAVRGFGSKTFQLKPVVKLIPSLLEDRDKDVREQTKQLTVEVYRWIGGAVKPQLANIKPVQFLQIIAKDTNVMVVAAAAKCLAGLAAGLRKKFSPYAGQCVPTLLEKFKEKKPMVVTALREAIDAIYLTTTLDSVSEDVIASMESKSPSVKVETALFLSRCFVRCTLATLPKKVLKPLVAPMIKAINEPDPNVRDASAECLGTALKVVGEKGMGPFIAEVDKLKQDKIKECCEKSVLLNANGQPRGGATSSSATSAPAKKVTIQEPPPAAAMKKPAPGKRPAPTKKKPPASRAKKAGGKPPPAEKPDIVEREMSVEEIEEKAAEILPAQVLPGLASSNWKERLAAMEAFTETVKRTENWDAACQVCVGVLCVRKPGLRDSNFQVEKLKLELLALLAASGRFSRRSVDLALHDAVDRVGDGKSGAAAGTALTAMAEATSLGYLAENVVGYAFTQKNPKNQAESLNWLAQAIKEFGFQGVNAKAIKDSVKKALAAINPAVRQAGITLLGVMYMYVGPPLRVLFEDEKAALLQQIDAEIEKVRDTPAPQPTRGVAAARAGSAAESDEREEEDEDGGGEGGIGIQDMVTRSDVSAQLTPVLLEQMSDKNWKVRCEALSSLKLIITEAKYITGNLAELPSALKPRLTESNKMLQMTTLGIVQAMGGALGPHCKQHIRTVGPSIITCMGDAKPQVRQTAVATLNAWVDHTGILPLLEGEGLTDLIKTENPFLRSELLTWLAPKLEVTKKVPAADLRESLPYLYTCLEDRNADVRKAANDTLVPFMIHVGYPRMTEAASKLKPSSRTQVMGILEKAREKLPAKAPPPPKKAASSAKLKLEEAAPPPHKSASAPMLETMDQQKVIWIDELLKDGEKCNLLAGHADQLVLVSSLQLRLTYSKYMQECAGEVITIYRCLMATLIAAGDPKDPVRKVVKNILRLVYKVYPASKMFTYIIDGLKSKNARQRTAEVLCSVTGARGRSSVTCAQAPPSAKSKKPADEEFGPTLVNNDSKRQRLRDEEKLKVLKWNFTQPRQEFVDQLKEQMQNNVSTPLLTQMFHADFKHHIKAIDALCEAITTSEDATVAQLDLVLKWLTLRFFDTNPSVLLRGLDYLGSLFTALSQRGYNLPDAEASSFIPYLVMKAGDPKDPVRKVVKNILRLVYKVYPASKMFTYIIDGLKSKNARQRTECLDELGYFIEVFGSTVCQASVRCGAEAHCSADRAIATTACATPRLNTRRAAPSAHRRRQRAPLASGQLADKDQSLLDERIKRSAKNRAACATRQAEPEDKQAKAASKNAAAADQRLQAAEAPPVRPRSLILDLEESMSESDCSGKARLIDIPDLEDEPIHLPVTRGRAPSPAMKVLHQSTDTQSTLDLVVSQIASKDIRTSIHALAQHYHPRGSLNVNTCGDSIGFSCGGSLSTWFLSRLLPACRITTCGDLSMRAILKRSGEEGSGKHFGLTSYKVYPASKMFTYIIDGLKSKNALCQRTVKVTCELVQRVLGSTSSAECRCGAEVIAQQIGDRDNGVPQRRRSNNRRVQPTSSSAGQHAPLRRDSCGQDQSLLDRSALKRSAKNRAAVRDAAAEPEDQARRSLRAMNALLDQRLHFFKRRYLREGRVTKETWRLSKTILHSLAKLKGNEIVTHLKLIENAEESEISQYLQKVLRTGFSVKPTTNNTTIRMRTGYSNVERDMFVGAISIAKLDVFSAIKFRGYSNKSTRRLSKSCHDMLAEIFKKIGSKENTKEGLSDLYDFKLTYPDADIEPFLCKSSQFFQSYIERGLRDIERARQSKPGSKPSGGGGSGGPSATAAASELENLSAFDYMEKLKALRARCGHTEAAGVAKKEALGNSTANKENRKSPAEGGMSMISQKAGEAEEASGDRESPGSNAGAGSSGGAGSATETNTAEVLDLKKRLEKIKTGAIKTE
ncbi:PREDICTED: cytoskeleton-associated protein 5-like [Priapulus caudatus]|uniref:Cytoskeleton-associated protein 5-like n=1 Tax=Priapulus caudatus TaxID=37621 RepID=A0ABM1EAN0_PRICU|nr:PREDICTED: cytoskeleton-associated protein 5-like [Priapulus caudatus]